MIRIRIKGLSGSGLRFLAGSGFNEYGSETLAKYEDNFFLLVLTQFMVVFYKDPDFLPTRLREK